MSQLLAFHNGRIIPASGLVLDVADAGFVSAATATDFCRTYGRRLFRWPAHLARLRTDCAALGIPLPYPDAELTAAAERLVEANAPLHATDEVTLVTFATPGPLGHLSPTGADGPPTVGMHTAPLRFDRYRRFFTDGVTLEVVGRLSDGVVPAAVKHRSRLHWWVAARRATVPGAVPVLHDESGTPDTPVGSVLVVCDGAVHRARRGRVLESITMGVVAELCERAGIPFAEADLDIRPAQSSLMGRVTELLLAGSGFGVAGVRRLIDSEEERAFDWPGPVLGKLLAGWSELVGLDVGRQMVEGR